MRTELRLPSSRVLLGLVALAAIATQAWPQIGRVTWGPIPVETLTGNNGCLGVQHLNGHYYVTSRGLGAAQPHVVYIFNSAGTLVGQWNQSVGYPSTTLWGYRDGATDGSVLMFCMEGIIAVVNPADGTAASTIQTASGPVSVGTPQWQANPISLPAVLGTARGLEYDPAGNNMNGSFWTGNFGSTLYEVDLNGNILRSFPLPPEPIFWSIYGLAKDPINNWVWVNSAPNAGPIRAIDLATGLVLPDPAITRSYPVSGQGGLTGVPGGAGGSGNHFDLVGLDQAAPDSITGYEVHPGACLGSNGLRPVLAVRADRWSIGLDIMQGMPNSQGLLLLGGLGPVVIPLPNGCTLEVIPIGILPIMLDWNGSFTWTLTLPPGTSVGVRLQALLLDAGVPWGFTMSNAADLVHSTPEQVEYGVRLEGQIYWAYIRVINGGPELIAAPFSPSEIELEDYSAARFLGQTVAEMLNTTWESIREHLDLLNSAYGAEARLLWRLGFPRFRGTPGQLEILRRLSAVLDYIIEKVGICRGQPTPCTGPPNGCSIPGGHHMFLDFILDCCNAHDQCYGRGGNENDRLACDGTFRTCIINASERSPIPLVARGLAQLFFGAVRKYGRCCFCWRPIPTWWARDCAPR